MRTLHGYFARELLKTFALTSIALTMLIVMGGGVANIFRGEGIGAEEMVKVFVFLTPVAVTLILPVAALFSATITYGRASADNEITACRAAGINIHRLLLSAGLLGLFVTLFTLLSWNYIIPGLGARIEDLTRKGLSQILLTQFQKARPLAFGKYRIMANHCSKLDPIFVASIAASQTAAAASQPDAPPAINPKHEFLQLSGVSFLEIENQELLRYGTADETIVEFDLSEEKPTATVTVDLQGVRTFDATRRQYFELQHQILGPIPVPMTIKRKIKFENLQNLRRLLHDPNAIPEVDEHIQYLTRDIMTVYLAEEIDASLSASRPVRFAGRDIQYDISATRWRIDPDSGQPRLEGVSVVEQQGKVRRIYHADVASMELKSALIRQKPVIMINLSGNVEIRPENPSENERVVRRAKQELFPVQFFDQPALQARMNRFNLETVLNPDEPMAELPAHQSKLRTRTIKLLQKYMGDIQGEIHFRFSYSLCAIAIVLAGAVLGIIVRNGQVLTAFGISCIPMAIVVISTIVGRNLADRPQLASLSVAVMWGGTVIMYGLTTLVAVKFLRR
jgi:lipopolysaccharide export LptBFGC system permease protein LptF